MFNYILQIETLIGCIFVLIIQSFFLYCTQHFFNQILGDAKMWHEARRQEKLVRAKMVDNVKRNERRKQFYESVRKEPEGFMQLHGQKMPVHMDPSIAEAAESPNAMRKWQGDPNILIDRFDVRVYLDHIPETSKQSKKNILEDDVIELQCDYERYRILVFNEYRKVSEKHFLNEIATKEFWPNFQQSNQSNAAYKKEIEKKKKLVDKRAAIAFTYADSETVQGSSSYQREQHSHSTSSSSDEDEFDEYEEIDTFLEPNILTAEQAAALNKIGVHYNVTSGAFLQLLNLDRKEQTSTAQIKEIDKAKLALSGRHAKADRAVLKRRRALIIGNLGSVTQSSEEATTTLLSFLAAANKSDINEDSSSSESEEEFVKTEFITSFGGEDEKCGKKEAAEEAAEEEGADREAVVQGPILPNKEYRRLLELSRRRSESPENSWEQRHNEYRGRRDRHGRYSRSPRRRSRSRSRNRERRRRSRPRSRDRQQRGCYSSSNSSAQSLRHSSKRHGKSGPTYSQKGKHLKTRTSSSSSSRDRHSNKVGNGSGHHQHTEQISRDERKLPIRASLSSSSDESDSPLSVRSSMSESEKERIERENRKRRIRKTKKLVKSQQNCSESATQEDAESRAERAAKKLRQQMHKALTKTAAQLKEEEEQRQKEMMREKKKREEQLLEESRLLRKREREKRRTEEEQERNKAKERSGCRIVKRRRRSSSNS